MRTYALSALLLASTTAAAAPKRVHRAGKAAPPAARRSAARGGHVWTYTPVPAPAALPEAMARLAPSQPKIVVVTVKSVEKKGAETVATIEEKHSFDISRDPKEPKIVDTVVTGTITCDAKGKFDIDPVLFFFAGEPGGVHGLAFDKFERKKETSLKLTKGTIGENEWIEELSGHFTRTPAKGSEATKLVGGKIDIERKFTPQPQEKVVNDARRLHTRREVGLITRVA